jgi:hypothetical protein
MEKRDKDYNAKVPDCPGGRQDAILPVVIAIGQGRTIRPDGLACSWGNTLVRAE